MKKLPFVLLAFSLACPLFGAAGPDRPAAAQPYVRPYQTPRPMKLLERRVKALESAQGMEVKDFEYTLPKDQKLVVSVRYAKEGLVDTDVSGMFTITNAANSPSNNGYLTVTQIIDRPQGEAGQRRAPRWQIDIDGRQSCSVAAGALINSEYLIRTASNSVEGKELQDEKVLYTAAENGKKFTLTISVQALPMAGEDKFDEVVRKPVK